MSRVDFLDMNMTDKDQIDDFIRIQKRNILRNVKEMIDQCEHIGDIVKFVEQEFICLNNISEFF